MIKVVYFDEGSATDFLQIKFGGDINFTDEQQDTAGRNLKVVTNGDVKFGKNVLSLIKASVSAGFSADVSKSKNTLYKTTLSNTILADFVNYANDPESEDYIEVLNNFNVKIIEGSFAYVKLFSPYLKMIKEDSEITKEIQDINFLEMDELLNNAKGYYDLLADKEDDEVVLRFNINAFRNSYSLADLTKMNLVFYGIEVGECNKDDLLLENELDNKPRNQNINQRNTKQNQITSEDLLNGPEKPKGEDKGEKPLKVYDVILAGIKRSKG
ncbi:DUF6414 family protein [Terribacillus saccharophilus]|uniref:DUF6414 family protein n=1 Tax=Terribacillus saccharophilus TaxID=361277 RepID=UPI003981E437